MQPQEDQEKTKPLPDQSDYVNFPSQEASSSEQRVSESKAQSRDLMTDQGRRNLYRDWLTQRIAEGKVDPDQFYVDKERADFLADWLRWLIASGKLTQRKRLPSYAALGALPFRLNKKQVTWVINQ